MISILCYGRNDDHSPGIQKRAALSLNGFARLLDAPEDEIVFVDYNTPDEQPTFPEAIADTLTDEARKRLRIIRVRPRHHAPWRECTHLPVPEPLARNAGLRRTNPANAWVLSSNTDMVLLPRRACSLSALCAGLEPGSWHLPRYEVPEAVWQGFTRTDPDATMAELAELADRLPLREIVRGAGPAVFDNHGDFQLIRRDDLFAVHGFDERMLNGWAVDSNLSLRLLMRLGRVGSLAGEMDAFHCAHHRAVSRLHGHGRSENDYQRFYRDVERAELPHQADSWGFADTDLEEIRLDGARRRRWLGALAAAGADPRPVESVYNPETSDVPYYPADQVLTHLLDLLAERDEGTVIGWCGARPRMLELFVAAWRALGRPGLVLLPETCSAISAGIQPVPLPQLLERADVVVFEFGCRSQDDPTLSPSRPGGWSDDDLMTLAPVREALLAVAEAERRKGPARLLIAINAVHNRFEPLVLDLVGAARIPFATRLRHGYALAPPSDAEPYVAPAVAVWLGRLMARPQPVPVSEAVRLMGWTDRLLAGDLPPARLAEAARSAQAMLSLLDHPHLVGNTPPDRLERARHAVAATRGSVRLAGRIGVPLLAGPPPDGPWRLATLEDWEDEEFAQLARRHFDGPLATNLTRRSALQWSRIRVLWELRRRGLTEPGTRIALVTDGFDPLADVLSTLGGHLHLLQPQPQSQPPSPGIRDPRRLCVDAAPAIRLFDAIIVLTPDTEVPPVAPQGVVIRVERVRIDGAARLPAGATLSTATVDSSLWPGEPVDLPHFLAVAEDGSITTLAVTVEDQRSA